MDGIQEVSGSIPLISTKMKDACPRKGYASFYIRQEGGRPMLFCDLLSTGRGVTALIGGGGKTTAMYTLARELSPRGTVLCCTTTRILPPDHLPVLLSPGEEAVSAALADHGCACLGTPAENGKLSAPELPMARLAALADYVLVEAGGSRGLPVKAHLPHEPVIPPEARRTILLAGASAFFRPAGEAVHRPEQFCRLTGAAPTDPVRAENLASLILGEGLGDTIFINQAESGEALREARRLAALLPLPLFAGALQRGEWTCLS